MKTIKTTIHRDFNIGDCGVALVTGGLFLTIAPDSYFYKSQVDGWILALVIFCASLVAGFISALLFYKNSTREKVDPFYQRAFSWAAACLLLSVLTVVFRPLTTIMACIFLAFNAGAILGYHLYRLFWKISRK